MLNDLSSKLMSMNETMEDFANNKNVMADARLEEIMDKKIFFLYDTEKSNIEKAKKPRIKKGTCSEASKKSSDSSEVLQRAFSLRDL